MFLRFPDYFLTQHRTCFRDATDMLLVDINEKANGKEIVDLNDISGTVVTSIIGSLGLDNGIEMVC